MELLLLAAHRFKLLLLAVVLVLISLVAYCSSVIHEGAAIVTVFPTPLLTPAVEFADGVSKVPEDYALFVESWRNALGEGSCGAAGLDGPDYQFSDHRLSGLLFRHELKNLIGKMIT